MTGEYTTHRNMNNQYSTHGAARPDDTRYATRVINTGKPQKKEPSLDRTMVFDARAAQTAARTGSRTQKNANSASDRRRTAAARTAPASSLKTKNNMELKPDLAVTERKKNISKVISITAAVVVFAFVIVILVSSISDIYRTEHMIASLEKQVEALKTESGQLRIQLEEKNDIRTIEELATKKYGMVREDSLQRQFVSLSSGESIEVYESETETSGSVLLSSVFSAIERFFNGND